jgi:cyclomaltodextrinase
MRRFLNPARRGWSILLAGLLLGSGMARAEQNYAADAAPTAPAWLRDGIVYEVFPRDFSAAGNLHGVTAGLDDLHRLGVTILWVMPIHPIGEKGRKGTYGSPYSVRDYYAVNPDYGTLDDFKKLVAAAHERGMKVLMDLVANHTSWDSVMMRHPEYYKQDAKGNPLPPVPAWSDVAGLNYANPKLREYMIAMMTYWVQKCDVDGFRCDVAFMVPTDFWVQARAALEQVKPGLIWLAEASKPELMVKAFDVDYDWPLLASLNNVLIRGAPAGELQATWEKERREFPKGTLHLRISDDHDEARAIARYGIHGALAASAFLFTLDGVPLLYNGMEVGDATESGDPALFEKLTVFWHPKDRPPLRKIYHGLIRLREQNPAFRSDRVEWLRNSAASDVVTFLRPGERDEFLVIVNFANRPVSGKIDLPHAGDFRPVQIDGMPRPAAGGLPGFSLAAFEWRIYQRTVSPD